MFSSQLSGSMYSRFTVKWFLLQFITLGNKKSNDASSLLAGYYNYVSNKWAEKGENIGLKEECGGEL